MPHKQKNNGRKRRSHKLAKLNQRSNQKPSQETTNQETNQETSQETSQIFVESNATITGTTESGSNAADVKGTASNIADIKDQQKNIDENIDDQFFELETKMEEIGSLIFECESPTLRDALQCQLRVLILSRIKLLRDYGIVMSQSNSPCSSRYKEYVHTGPIQINGKDNQVIVVNEVVDAIQSSETKSQMLDTKLQMISSFSPRKGLLTAEFQKELSTHRGDKVISFLERHGHQNIDWTRNYVPSTFRSYVTEVFSCNCSDDEWPILILMLQMANLLTREELSKPCETFKNSRFRSTAQHLAISKESSFLFRHLCQLFDFSVIDWQATESIYGNTPLSMLLDVNICLADYTDDQRHADDTRAAELIRILPDTALNIPNILGETPLTLAISYCKVLSLQALISRLPAVDFYPELRCDFTYNSTVVSLESVNEALKFIAPGSPIDCKFKHQWPVVRSFVETGRVLVMQYSDTLREVISLYVYYRIETQRDNSLLLDRNSVPSDITSIIFEYARPDPNPDQKPAPSKPLATQKPIVVDDEPLESSPSSSYSSLPFLPIA